MERTEHFKVADVQRYVDVLTNGGFKALFGDMNNKDVVISIINVLLPEHRRVVDIDYLPTEHQGQVQGKNKEYHYDFMCRDVFGTVFIVELQRYYEDSWFKRCVSYASRVYDRQNKRGESYEIPPVYLIGLMGIDIDHQDPELWDNRYVSEYTFREKYTNELLDETIVIIFAELARFSKDAEMCETEQDKMLYLLKNIGNMTDQPQWLQHEVYSRIFDACEIAGFTEDKLIKYDQDMYDEKRLQGERSAYRRMGLEEGYREGREQGIIQGLAEGRAEGRAEGKEEGLAEGKAEVVRAMFAKGMSLDAIAEILDVRPEQVEQMLVK